MSKIILNDLLNIKPEEYENTRIKFNQHNGEHDPMDLYLQDPDIVNVRWLLWRSKNQYYKKGRVAICLLKLSYDTWLLTTIKRITKCLDVKNGIGYEGEELKEYSKYFGRVIIKYHKTSQTQYRIYDEKIDKELEVLEVLPALFDGDEFPGYDKVRLTYSQLHSIIERQKKSWIAALKNQKAVYLITDRETGKLYVGSATSDNGMLLARWSSYAKNGHGGNVELKSLIAEKEEGFDYVKKNFQYSILENYNARVDDHVILERESWWKETLQSRKHGYNSN